MIYLKLDTSNDAFSEGNYLLEVSRILQKVVNEIDSFGELPKILRDINGNKVGTISENPESNILYYTVEKQLIDIDGIKETDGWKDITVYTIEDNIPKIMCKLTVLNENSTEEEIQTWLDNEEIGGEFEFVKL